MFYEMNTYAHTDNDNEVADASYLTTRHRRRKTLFRNPLKRYVDALYGISKGRPKNFTFYRLLSRSIESSEKIQAELV